MEVKIESDFIKLDSLLKLAGVAQTGGHAKIMIMESAVSVNNEICTMRGKKIYPKDSVTVKLYNDEGKVEQSINIKVSLDK